MAIAPPQRSEIDGEASQRAIDRNNDHGAALAGTRKQSTDHQSASYQCLVWLDSGTSDVMGSRHPGLVLVIVVCPCLGLRAA